MWLMIVTMTTVGYGDSVPQTHFGRFVCVIVMIVGTILVSICCRRLDVCTHTHTHTHTCTETDRARVCV